MALFPPLDATVDEIRAALAPLRNDFSVAVYNCQNAFAVGAIIRVAHSFLAREIIVIGREPYYQKASMAMEKYETIVTVDDEAAFHAHVAGRPVWAIEKDHARISITAGTEFPRDVVLVLVSGGGSAVFEALRPGVTLEQVRGVSDALMRAGADIVALNAVRRALSRVKAGGLARACGPASSCRAGRSARR